MCFTIKKLLMMTKNFIYMIDFVPDKNFSTLNIKTNKNSKFFFSKFQVFPGKEKTL